MNLANLVYALSIAKLHPVLAGAALAALILVIAGWALRWTLMVRRQRARPLALIVADAIAQGSVHDTGARLSERHDEPPVEGAAAGRPRLRLSAYQKLKGDEDSWSFSLREAENLIATFVYPGQEEARAAHKAMRRALKDITLVLQPMTPNPHFQADPADFRPQRVWTEQAENIGPEFGTSARPSAQFR